MNIADQEATEAKRLGGLYSAIQAKEYACSEIRCVFPHDGNCWCFNTALSRYVAQREKRGPQ